MAMAIRRLPDGVIDKIRSASSVTSLNQVVSGLVKNALDAEASKIVIYVDYTRGNVTVEDNGEGIDPSEFGLEAGLLQPYSWYSLVVGWIFANGLRYITISAQRSSSWQTRPLFGFHFSPVSNWS